MGGRTKSEEEKTELKKAGKRSLKDQLSNEYQKQTLSCRKHTPVLKVYRKNASNSDKAAED